MESAKLGYNGWGPPGSFAVDVDDGKETQQKPAQKLDGETLGLPPVCHLTE